MPYKSRGKEEERKFLSTFWRWLSYTSTCALSNQDCDFFWNFILMVINTSAALWIIFILKIWLTLHSSDFDMFKAICFTNMKVRKDWNDGNEVMETGCHFPSLRNLLHKIKTLFDEKRHPSCLHYFMSIILVIESQILSFFMKVIASEYQRLLSVQCSSFPGNLTAYMST